MKSYLFISILILFNNFVFAEEGSVLLVGKILPTANLKIIENTKNENSIEVESYNNTVYSNEGQKFFITNTDHQEVDLKTRLLTNASGAIRHEIILKYVQDLNKNNKSLVFNIQTN